MRKHVQNGCMFAHFLFLSKFPGNHCPARLSRVMLNLKHAANSIAPLVHAPAWGATTCHPRMAEHRSRFQSTHPRGVRHAPPGADHRPRPVSIHAPAWGATWAAMVAPIRSQVSIHAPAWGATPSRRILTANISSFNPRTRVGCDNVPSSHGRTQEPVSIHAPAWGATRAAGR